MKLFIIIFAALVFISCEEDLIIKDEVEDLPVKELGVCVYKILPKCLNANPALCPPPLAYLGCIQPSQSIQYSNVDLYKIEDCGCEL